MAKDFKEEFIEYMTRGPGEAAYGGIIKSAASKEKRRLQKKLETANLFPHIEHEDRMQIEKCDHAWAKGEKMVKRCQSRKSAIDDLLDADAGLRITDEDLR